MPWHDTLKARAARGEARETTGTLDEGGRKALEVGAWPRAACRRCIVVHPRLHQQGRVLPLPTMTKASQAVKLMRQPLPC